MNIMIQLAKKTSWAGQKTAWICWKNNSKTRLRPWQKRRNAWKAPFSDGFWVDCNGLQYCGREDSAKDVGRTPLGRRLALPGPVGQLAFAHIIQRLECPKEARAALRAVFSSSLTRSLLLLQRQCSLSPLIVRRSSKHVL